MGKQNVAECLLVEHILISKHAVFKGSLYHISMYGVELLRVAGAYMPKCSFIFNNAVF